MKMWKRPPGQLWEKRSVTVWDAQAEKFREVAHKLKDSSKLEDLIARATMLRLADDYEKAASADRNKKIITMPGR